MVDHGWWIMDGGSLSNIHCPSSILHCPLSIVHRPFEGKKTQFGRVLLPAAASPIASVDKDGRTVLFNPQTGKSF
jgi:hypothetical protein